MQVQDLYISVVLPCYNEKGNIIALIEALHEELSFCKHQIVVVDDNSPDGTYDLVLSKNYDFVKAVQRKTDPSLAKSIRRGLEEGDGNAFVVMDSDFNHQPSYVPILVRNLVFYDCVSGSRFVYGGGMNSNFRHISSWLFNLFVRIMTRKYITDSLYGFFAVRKETLDKLDYNKIFWGYGDYCIRMMYYLQKNKVSVLQIPTKNGERLAGQGNSRFLKVLWKYMRETFRLAFFPKTLKKP